MTESGPDREHARAEGDVLLSWSGGKDGVMALQRLRQRGTPVAALVTAVRERDRRVNFHGTAVELIEAQAHALGLELVAFELPEAASNSVYARRLNAALEPWRDRGVRRMAYGDLFLADIRAYRERLMTELGMEAVFPIWHENGRALVEELCATGYRALITCIDSHRVPEALAGVELSPRVIERLPAGVDPAGEGGEFHSFVWNGPPFSAPVTWQSQALRREERFVYYMLG